VLVTELTELVKEVEENESDWDLLGNGANVTAYPHDEREVSHLLRWANEKNFKVIPVGGGTKRGFGGLKATGDLCISLARITGIEDHSPGDLTVRVKAGTKVAELKEHLAQYGQTLALDPYWPEYATIGGVIAANDSGPKRLKYGSARDHVLGLRVVYPDGRMIRTGGQVVKNVAGYDMNKLFIGSMGTLGIMTEVILKLRPLPRDEALVLITIPESEFHRLDQFVVTLLDSTLDPASLELFNPPIYKRLLEEKGYGLAVSFEDRSQAVAYQIEWLTQHLSPGFKAHLLGQEEARAFWQKVSHLPPNPAVVDSDLEQVVLKIGSLNMDVLAIMKQVQQEANQIGIKVEAHGGLGHGITYVYIHNIGSEAEQMVSTLRRFVGERHGYVLLRHAPLAFRQKVGVWGEKPAHFFLLEGIRRTIDPRFTLNPKRFIGGL
jgi:glycolate oxidase FAD binding subunit